MKQKLSKWVKQEIVPDIKAYSASEIKNFVYMAKLFDKLTFEAYGWGAHRIYTELLKLGVETDDMPTVESWFDFLSSEKIDTHIKDNFDKYTLQKNRQNIGDLQQGIITNRDEVNSILAAGKMLAQTKKDTSNKNRITIEVNGDLRDKNFIDKCPNCNHNEVINEKRCKNCSSRWHS